MLAVAKVELFTENHRGEGESPPNTPWQIGLTINCESNINVGLLKTLVNIEDGS